MDRVSAFTPKRKVSKEDRPFVEVVDDPWSYCTKGDKPLLVSYGAILKLLPVLTRSFDALDMRILASGSALHLGRRRIRIKLLPYKNGGEIYLYDGNRSARIYDVKPFLGKPAGDLASTMELVRKELRQVGLHPRRQSWHTPTSLPVNVNYEFPSVPLLPYRRVRPFNYYNRFGHHAGPVYYADEKSSYLARMARYEPGLEELFEKRHSVSKPAAEVIKRNAATHHGRSLRYRPDIYYSVIEDVRRSMDAITTPETFRSVVDNVTSLSPMESTGSSLGDLEVTVLPYITIAKQSQWWAEPVMRKRGNLSRSELTEQEYVQHLRERPFDPITVKRTVFNWETFTTSSEPYTIRQRHSEDLCSACQEGRGGPDIVLHDVVRELGNVVPDIGGSMGCAVSELAYEASYS